MQVVRELIHEGADVDVRDDTSGGSCLHFAAGDCQQTGQTGCSINLEKADSTTVPLLLKPSRTFLWLASSSLGFVAMCRLAHGPDFRMTRPQALGHFNFARASWARRLAPPPVTCGCKRPCGGPSRGTTWRFAASCSASIRRA